MDQDTQENQEVQENQEGVDGQNGVDNTDNECLHLVRIITPVGTFPVHFGEVETIKFITKKYIDFVNNKDTPMFVYSSEDSGSVFFLPREVVMSSVLEVSAVGSGLGSNQST